MSSASSLVNSSSPDAIAYEGGVDDEICSVSSGATPPRARSPAPSWMTLRVPDDELRDKYYAFDVRDGHNTVARRRIPRPWGKGQGRPSVEDPLPRQGDTTHRPSQNKKRKMTKGLPPPPRYPITIDAMLNQPFLGRDPEANMRSEAELPDRMRYTAEYGTVEDVAGILEEAAVLGSNTPHAHPNGRVTMLDLAVCRNNAPLVAELLRHGAAVDGVPDEGEELFTEYSIGGSTLCRAAFRGQLEVMRACLDAGADVEWREEDKTLLMKICEACPSVETVSLLLSEGCDVHATNDMGRCALMVLASKGFYNAGRCRAVADLLIRAGADVNRCDECGITAQFLLDDLP